MSVEMVQSLLKLTLVWAVSRLTCTMRPSLSKATAAITLSTCAMGGLALPLASTVKP